MLWTCLRVVVAVVVCHTIGMTWHGPSGFLNLWCSYAFPGKKIEDIPDHGPKPIYMTSVAYACGAFLLSYLQRYVLMVHGLIEAVMCSLLLAGVVAFTQVPHDAFLNKPLGFYLLNRSYDTTILIAMGLVVYLI